MLIRPIAEAISFADKVVVLSKRPTMVKEVIDIHFANAKSPIHNRTCPEFNDYLKYIWEIFDHEI